ncbi:MAG: aminotransferase class IV [Luminiphilus sp.]|jgi:D-alanine transaminase|nr:aminotransferase class IV [Luminiphilus sp.]
MTTAYLNGDFQPLAEVRISPLDRGFLFGDGVYEVIPSYDGRPVAMQYHLERLRHSLECIHLSSAYSEQSLRSILAALIDQNGGGDLGIYLHISRGAEEKRQHAFSQLTTPTTFAYTFPINKPSDGSAETAQCCRVVTARDQRWGRCHIKSTALLGNVLHMMEAVHEGAQEALLFNDRDELTEATTCNVFVVRSGKVLTPPLDHEKLPGVTRRQCLEFLQAHTDWIVEVRPVTRDEVLSADEVWLTSSTKELAPVITIDGKIVADGKPGPRWSAAQQLFHERRFDSP